MTLTDRARAYNTPDFVLKIPEDTRIGETLPARVGAPAPEFEAPLLDGGSFRLADAKGKRHVVLMMGSITSPMCAIHVPAMNELYRKFRDRGVDFYLIYVKESHPGENYRHHTSWEQKLAHARDLKEQEKVEFPILVDSLEGDIHLRYGPWPTSLFVINRDGRLFYRSAIANPHQLEPFLEALLESDHLAADPDRVPHLGYFEYILEDDPDQAEHHRVYARAGQKAFEDFWKLYPALRNRWP